MQATPASLTRRSFRSASTPLNMHRLLPFVVAALVALISPALVEAQPTVTATQGSILGVNAGTYNIYYSIPYATPPVGDLRFTYPTAPQNYSGGVLNATLHKYLCPTESAQLSTFTAQRPNTNEDCLTLSIWQPVNATAGSNLPVAVEFGGGGFISENYDVGTNIIGTGTQFIYVYVQYRVNAFGFLALEGLTRETGAETNGIATSGNYGLADQQAALRWVQANVHAFGGDQNHVTIIGESAGSWSMCFHQISPLSKGLFNAMITESGGCDQPIVASLQERQGLGELYAANVGCSLAASNYNTTTQVSCLRSKSVEVLLNGTFATGDQLWFYINDIFPVVDGWLVPDYPSNLRATGQINAVPLLIGSNADEANFILAYTGEGNFDNITYQTVALNIANATTRIGVNVSAAQAFTDYHLNPNTLYSETRAYPDGAQTGATASLVSFLSAFFFQCAIRREAVAYANQGQPVFLYDYNYDGPVNFGADGTYASHGYDLITWLDYSPAMVQALATNGSTATGSVASSPSAASNPPAPNFELLFHSMQQMWLSFIVNYDPNNRTGVTYSYSSIVQNLPQWPVYNGTDSGLALQLGDQNHFDNANITVRSSPWTTECDMQDALIPYTSSVPPRCASGYYLANYKECVAVPSTAGMSRASHSKRRFY